MYFKTALETPAKQGVLDPAVYQPKTGPKISELIPMFLKHGQFELSFSPQTVFKYGECLHFIIRDLGDMPVTAVNLTSITELKQKILMRGAGDARVSSMVFALKSFLRFCRDNLELEVLQYQKIKSPKRRRRDVIYLTNEEIEQFVGAIQYKNLWSRNQNTNPYRMDGLRFRTLVEVLLGTGMRISEALSLQRDSINFEKKEAKIIGKGSKERIVFFNDRSLEWVKLYLNQRKDSFKAMFVTQRGTALSKGDVNKLFQRNTQRAGINKHITPHILRHTMATNLLFNGCPISHVKEILGHDRLETTCRYYLGLDKAKAKEAHGKFLNY